MSIRRLRYANHGVCHPAICVRKESEAVVLEGLAYSPSRIAELTDKGIPVNGLAAATKMFYDGDTTNSMHLGAERERFVDVNDLWEKHIQLRERAKAAVRAKSKKS